jgi:hypothetical protein
MEEIGAAAAANGMLLLFYGCRVRVDAYKTLQHRLQRKQ